MSEKLMEPEKITLTADEFMSRIKPSSKRITVPEIGEISIRAITVAERDEIKSGSTITGSGKVNESQFVAITLIKGMVEPKLTPSYIAGLQQSHFGIVAEISKQIWKMSGIDEDVKNA